MKLTIGLISAFMLGLLPLPAQTQADDPLVRWMDKRAQVHLQARENEIAAVRTLADAQRRQAVVRRKLLDALGGLPDYSGPLHARITGRIQAEGYVIEKVIYESLPGYFVTANLYRPSQPGRYPAVLLQAGHTQEGKAEPQLLAANLALKGFVALAFDPVGQGEREQTYSVQLRAPAAGWSSIEHMQAGAQAALIGEGVARYFIWDAKRSIDYLVSRSDVDPERIGAAGCSGGGALTTFIGALDSRLKAVIPACAPNSYRLLFAGSNPHAEMNLPQHLARGLDTADLVELAAPTPWMLQATEGDFFTPAGTRLVYDEALRWYRLFGAEKNLAFVVGPGPHGTPLVNREAAYEWMIRWLKGGRGDARELPVKLYTNHELEVTRTGRVEDEAGSRKLHQILLDSWRAKRKPGTADGLLAELRKLKIPAGGPAPAIRVLRESAGPQFRQQQIQFESEPGILLDGTLYLPTSPERKPAVLLVAGKLPSQLAEPIASKGRVVLIVEPRRSLVQDDRYPFVGDWLANLRADQIGLSLAALRAHDILRAVDLLSARPEVEAGSIRAAAQGIKGVWLLLAAAADPRIRKLWLDKTPHSLVDALRLPMTSGLPEVAIPGFALHWDLDDVAKAMGERSVLWTDPTDWMGRVAPLGPRFRYRWVLGDLTDRSNERDMGYAQELIQ
jgi:cephalosporin-C deacetylase-like acetyl esterase